MMRLGLIGAAVSILLGIQCTAASASAPAGGGFGELSRLNAEIMRHPKDTNLNLAYARLAEKLGEWRLALAAYERVLSYEPGNPAALDGAYRMRTVIAPNTTQWLLSIGATYESNPAYIPVGTDKVSAVEPFGSLSVDDERTINGTRWRTLGDINGIANGVSAYEYLDYAYAGATTGPVWELFPGVSVNPAVGGGGSYFDNHLFFGEAIAQATFEAYPYGAYESVRLRAVFRDYDTFFVPEHYGDYFEATGKFTVPLKIPNVAFSLTPWVRWASIDGALGVVSTSIGIQPGDYTDFGGRLNGYYAIEDWVIFGGNIALSQRDYRDEPVAAVPTKQRSDSIVSPGASIIFPHLLQYQNTLRFDYTYLKDNSNDATKTYSDNIVTVTAQRSF